MNRETKTLKRKSVNPWTWQDAMGYSQAVEVEGAERVLYCSGQGATDDEGRPVHPGDMRAQLTLAVDNLEAVLREADLTLSDVVRLDIYTTDMDGLWGAMDVVGARFAGNRPASTMVGVTRLAFPEMLVEIEAVAVA